jgi:hypothetical protein
MSQGFILWLLLLPLLLLLVIGMWPPGVRSGHNLSVRGRSWAAGHSCCSTVFVVQLLVLPATSSHDFSSVQACKETLLLLLLMMLLGLCCSLILEAQVCLLIPVVQLRPLRLEHYWALGYSCSCVGPVPSGTEGISSS